ncbi:MAG: hypothetical protein IPI55_10035 [Flavobacteriales bacterium]|nr:hypothetical protein [Flavobacteriales bacterium]
MMEQRNGELDRWVGRTRQADQRGVVKEQRWPGTLMAFGVIVFLVTLWMADQHGVPHVH